VSAFDTTRGSLLIQLFIFQQKGKWEKASLANKHKYLRKAFAGALAWKTRGVDAVFLDCLILLSHCRRMYQGKRKSKNTFH
jgi:hypothetical protein